MSSTRPLLADPDIHEGEAVDEIGQLREDFGELRAEMDELQESLERDRTKIIELLHALRAIFNGDMAATAQGQVSTPSGTNPRWEALKRAFPGRCAELIDTLIAHGPLNTGQIAAIMRADSRTINQLIHKLNKAGGIEKNGGKFSLR